MAHKKSSAWASMQSDTFINDASASLSLGPSQTPASLRDLGKKKHYQFPKNNSDSGYPEGKKVTWQIHLVSKNHKQ